ncbi:MAG: flagellar hook-associated protein FlgK [Planctomycetota bacterium]
MGLTNSLAIGRSGLLAAQTALQVTGNNLANAANPDYRRQRVSLAANPDSPIGNNLFVGTGVQVTDISRRVDEALEARLRTANADASGSQALADALAQIESIQNELSGIDLSTKLGDFFNAWNDITANPQDLSLRTLAVEEARALTLFINDIRSGLGDIQKQTDDRARNTAAGINDLLDRIAQSNRAIVLAEGGQAGEASGLRDNRDALLSELSQFLEITTFEQSTGSVDVFVGSTPLILNSTSRGVELETFADDGELNTRLVIIEDRSEVDTSTGELGELVQFRKGDLQDAIDAVDQIANSLIFEVNKIHSQSQGLVYFDSVEGTNRVTDPTLALDDPTLEIGFTPVNGSFKLHLNQASTGQRTTFSIDVDLDGIGSDTTLNSLIADINAISGVTASITPDGRLALASDSSDFQLSFSDDTSGALATLGVNTFFTGEDAFDIAINDAVVGDPRFVAAGQNHLPGDNAGALGIAGLRDAPIESLQGLSITQAWNRHIEDFAIRNAQAQDAAVADQVVVNNLAQQQAAISGVNSDEETINLIQYQRMFQASARFISVVDELTQTLLSIV